LDFLLLLIIKLKQNGKIQRANATAIERFQLNGQQLFSNLLEQEKHLLKKRIHLPQG